MSAAKEYQWTSSAKKVPATKRPASVPFQMQSASMPVFGKAKPAAAARNFRAPVAASARPVPTKAAAKPAAVARNNVPSKELNRMIQKASTQGFGRPMPAAKMPAARLKSSAGGFAQSASWGGFGAAPQAMPKQAFGAPKAGAFAQSYDFGGGWGAASAKALPTGFGGGGFGGGGFGGGFGGGGFGGGGFGGGLTKAASAAGWSQAQPLFGGFGTAATGGFGQQSASPFGNPFGGSWGGGQMTMGFGGGGHPGMMRPRNRPKSPSGWIRANTDERELQAELVDRLFAKKKPAASWVSSCEQVSQEASGLALLLLATSETPALAKESPLLVSNTPADAAPAVEGATVAAPATDTCKKDKKKKSRSKRNDGSDGPTVPRGLLPIEKVALSTFW